MAKKITAAVREELLPRSSSVDKRKNSPAILFFDLLVHTAANCSSIKRVYEACSHRCTPPCRPWCVGRRRVGIKLLHNIRASQKPRAVPGAPWSEAHRSHSAALCRHQARNFQDRHGEGGGSDTHALMQACGSLTIARRRTCCAPGWTRWSTWPRQSLAFSFGISSGKVAVYLCLRREPLHERFHASQLCKAGQKNCLHVVCLVSPAFLSRARAPGTAGCLFECVRTQEWGILLEQKVFAFFSAVQGLDVWSWQLPREWPGGPRGPDFVQHELAFLQLGRNKLWHGICAGMKDVCLIDHSVCADLVPVPSLVSCSDPWEVFHEAPLWNISGTVGFRSVYRRNGNSITEQLLSSSFLKCKSISRHCTFAAALERKWEVCLAGDDVCDALHGKCMCDLQRSNRFRFLGCFGSTASLRFTFARLEDLRRFCWQYQIIFFSKLGGPPAGFWQGEANSRRGVTDALRCFCR